MTSQESRIRDILDGLVRERRRLELAADKGGALEANRLAIVYWRQALARTVAAAERGYTGRRSRM
jgi:hypothetical protein